MRHPPSEAYALGMAAVLHAARGDVAAVRACVEAEIALAEAHGFRYWLAIATSLRGWVLGRQGAAQEGMALAVQGSADYQAIGARVNLTFGPLLVAGASLSSGRPEMGLAVLAEALDRVEKTGERLWEAELHRLHGELLLERSRGTRSADQGAAEASLRMALEIARGQGAKMLELRAATSLSRCWRGRGRKRAARELLGATYTWFGEGFDTEELGEAKALLEQLG
jgi:predicted ATPase